MSLIKFLSVKLKDNFAYFCSGKSCNGYPCAAFTLLTTPTIVTISTTPTIPTKVTKHTKLIKPTKSTTSTTLKTISVSASWLRSEPQKRSFCAFMFPFPLSLRASLPVTTQPWSRLARACPERAALRRRGKSLMHFLPYITLFCPSSQPLAFYLPSVHCLPNLIAELRTPPSASALPRASPPLRQSSISL
jgi:hypothetical protein